MLQNKIATADNRSTMLYTWDKVDAPIAVVQVVHGMAEHCGRYDALGKFLNSKNVIMIGNDLRGMGNSAAEGSLGYESGDMFSNDLNDQLLISELIKKTYPNLPLIVLGHSYGSFLSQKLLQINLNADAYMLSGSDMLKGPEVSLGKFVAKQVCRQKGGREPAKYIFKMSFEKYDKKFGGQGKWLSRDDTQVKKYNSDQMCGYVCSANFYRSFFNGLSMLYAKENLRRINKELPVYIFSGSNDIVGKFGAGVTKLAKKYISIGMKKVTLKLYEEGRHEMLNEINCEEVYKDILTFIKSV